MRIHPFIIALLSAMAPGLCAQSDTVDLEEITVSSPLWEQAAMGQNRVILDQKDLHAQSDATLAREIGIGTPVNISGTGYGLLANPVIRGTHANGTQVFWNGMPVNSPTLGTSDLNLFRSTAFNQISIIPGGSGTELGGGTMGGAILLSRELSYENLHEISLGGSLASYGEGALQTRYSFSTSGFALSAGLSHYQSENNFPFENLYGDEVQMNNAAISSHGAFVSLGKKLPQDGLLETHLLWQYHEREIPDSRSVFNLNKVSNALEVDRQVRWQNILSTNKLRLEQGFNIEDQNYQDLRYFIEDTNRFFQSSTEVEYQLLEKENISWMAGTYLNYHRAEGSNINQDQAEYGIRTSAVIKAGEHLLLKPALAESFLDDRALAFLPSLAAEYYFEKPFTLKAKTGKVFSIPTLNQRYWPGAGVVDIRPESGWNSEVSGQFRTKNHSLVLALYYNLLHNKVVWLPAPLGARPTNFRTVETIGAEVLGKHRIKISDTWQYRMAYSLNVSRPVVTANYGREEISRGNILIYVPTVTADTELGLQWKNWETGLAAEYNNGAYTSSDNDEFSRLDPFVLLHWQIEWVWENKNWELRPGMEIANLFDSYYELYAYRPMPGRILRFYINLNHQL